MGTATELVDTYRTGATDPSRALEASYARMDALDGTYNAIYTRDETAPDAAAESAQRWSKGQPLSDIDGVLVTIKENTPKVGLLQSLGTAAREPRVAQVNSPIVDRLLEAGAVIAANTTMPDFSGLGAGLSSRHGITHNAWNPDWNSGGSSSGAAVATALGYAPINIGTDIGGSIRLPAAFNAVVGFKPSFGRIPLLDSYYGRCAGPLTRTVRDAAVAMQYLSRPDLRDYSALPYEAIDWLNLDLDVSGMRVGLVFRVYGDKTPHPEVEAAVRRAADRFRDAGAEVVEVEPYLTRDYLNEAFLPMFMAHLWVQMHDPAIVDDLSKANPDMVSMMGAAIEQYTPLQLMTALDSLGPFQDETVAMLNKYDVLLSPTTGMLAGAADSMMFPELSRTQNYTSSYNATGTPAISVNCGFSSEGKPIGLQIATPRFQDLLALQVAAWYETHRGEEATPDWSAVGS